MTGQRGRGARLTALSAAHAATDFYQGCVAVLIPFLVYDAGYTYSQATGLVLGATIGSALAQPLFGVLSDRSEHSSLLPISLLAAGVGLGAVGFAGSYASTMAAVMVSGIGVAGFHPEAARLARRIGGGQARAMSWFIAGGNVGLMFAPLIAAPLLIAGGMDAVAALAAPGLVAAAALTLGRRWLRRGLEQRQVVATDSSANDWRAFSCLTGVAVLRSGVYFGIASLIGVFVIDEFGTAQGLAAGTLTLFLGIGIVGTLAGGWIADRRRRLTSIRLGFLLTIPGLLLIVSAGSLPVVLLGVSVTGIGAFLPFSVQTTLGQEYLPNRVATASGMTIGFSVSAGGAFAPVFGALSDLHGPRTALAAVILLSLAALALSFRLPEPGDRRGASAANPQVVAGAPPR